MEYHGTQSGQPGNAPELWKRSSADSGQSPVHQKKRTPDYERMNETSKNESARRHDRRDLIIVVILTAVILFYFRRILWTREYVYGGLDIQRHFYFFKMVSYELMRGGELPLWIPHIYCGMPLLAASQVTPFYPLDLGLMLTGAPLNMVFNWGLLAHLLAAQVFSYLLFRRLFGNRTAAVFGAIWFWNVFFLNSINTGDALNIRAMLLVPVVFYFVEAGLANDGRPRDFVFGTLALSMQVLCGGLQNTFYTMAAVAAYAVFRLACRARDGREIARPALGFAAMIVLGLAISGVQLLPAWEYSRLSVRSADVEWFRYWAIKPYQLIGYVVPMFEGRGTEHGYFGLAPIVLAAFSFPLWKSRRKYFFLALGTLAIVYSFGGNTTISSFIGGLPVVKGFRGPFRGAIFFNLSVFALACGALKGLMEPGEAGREARRRWVAPGAVAVSLVAGFVMIAAAARKYPGFDSATVAASAFFLTFSILTVIAAVASTRFRTAAGMVLVGLLAADLALNYGNFYSPTPISEAFARDSSVDFLERAHGDGDSRIAAYGTAHTNYFGLFGFESANGHHPFPTTRYATFLPLLKNPKVASLAGVKHYVIYGKNHRGRPYDPPVAEPEQVSFNEPSIEPMPRAFLVHGYRVLSGEGALDAMRSRGFDPAAEVILDEAPAGVDLPGDGQSQGKARIVTRGANEVVIETESAADSILVLTDSHYPGWIAEVDGVRVDILRANYVFRAVPLAAGKHRVAFRFRPMSFFIGAIVSCVGLICWIGWAAALVLWRRG